jgi:actin-related protein
MNIEEVDPGLVEDKDERLIRDVEHQHLMLDNRQKKVALVVSSLLPKPLLSTLLGTIFSALQASSITLLPSSVMTAVGAGVRSALVVDIGWEETVVSAIYEYREIMQWRGVRAGKLLGEAFAKVLDQSTEQTLGFEDVEEIMSRLGWCRERGYKQQSADQKSPDVEIPFPMVTLKVPFASLAEPVEDALFARGTTASDLDDHDQPLPLLMYNALLHLPIDIRRLCISRVIFTGGVSNMPGLKRRLTQELEALVQSRGWDPVKNYGSAQNKRDEHKILRERNSNTQKPKTAAEGKKVRFSSIDEQVVKVSETTDEPPSDAPSDAPSNIPARDREPELDPIIAKLNQQTLQAQGGEQVSGVVRAIDTLGAWAGASLVTTLRVRGIVEVEKDRFLQHGLAGATTKKDVSVAQQRQSLGPGVRPGAGERSSWTLGIWA